MKQYIETQRLILRPWQEEDRSHLARMNGDDKVMEYFLKQLSYEETIALYNQMQEEFMRYGFGAYAVEERGILQTASESDHDLHSRTPYTYTSGTGEKATALR